MPRAKDITGNKYGRLTAIGLTGKTSSAGRQWLCLCICGNEVTATARGLNAGETRSCGCLRNDKLRAHFDYKYEDFIGKQFGRLVVVDKYAHPTKGGTFWRCLCSCGSEHVTYTTYLTNGDVQSCGCLQRERASGYHRQNRDATVGRIFGRLTVTAVHTIGTQGQHTFYTCVCECGNMCRVDNSNLKTGATQSCGCYKRDRTLEVKTTHGLAHLRVYNIYIAMLDRCYNDTHPSFKWYGELGVRVCDEWRRDPHAFVSWAYANGYDDILSIDRIDPHGNYEPSNCRWATVVQQARNKRKMAVKDMDMANKIRNDPRIHTEIAKTYGISVSTVSSVKNSRTWKSE